MVQLSIESAELLLCSYDPSAPEERSTYYRP